MVNDRIKFFLAGIFGDNALKNTFANMVEEHENGYPSASGGGSTAITVQEDGTEIATDTTILNFVPDNGIFLNLIDQGSGVMDVTIGSTVSPGIPSGSSTIGSDADITVGDGLTSEIQFLSKKFSVSNRLQIQPIDLATRNAMTQLQPGDMVYIQDGFNSTFGLQLWDGFAWVAITNT